MNKLSIIVLAAGKGTRMQSDIPKVLHKVNGKSMIKHVLGQTHNLKPEKILVVIGYEAEQVKKHLENLKKDDKLKENDKKDEKNKD